LVDLGWLEYLLPLVFQGVSIAGFEVDSHGWGSDSSKTASWRALISRAAKVVKTPFI